MFDIILVANSPGELSALVKPMAESISANLKDARIILVLTPCQYTSGKEVDYVKSLRGITEVIPAKDYVNWIIKNNKPKIDFKEKGLVVYLGGDLTHAMLVAKKVRYPAWAYVQDWIGWTRFYKKFFVPDQKCFIKLAKNSSLKKKTAISGNLMVDSVTDIGKWSSPQNNVITFLPGSRAWQINHMTPIYKKIITELKSKMPNLTFQLVSSPFQQAIEIEGVKLIKFEEAKNSELIVTIPGTNTARLAAQGIPMISLFPLDNPDVIPLEGLPHFVSKIPYLGSKFKKFLAETINRRTKYFVLPNIKADKEIVPEFRGIINTDVVVQSVINLLKQPDLRRIMSDQLISAMGQPGAAQKITEAINEALLANT